MTSKDLSALITTLNTHNSRCTGAPQQVANGLFRLYDLIKLLLGEVDKDGITSAKVAAVDRTMNQNNSYAQSAYQESANAGYRVVELLKIVIEFFDTDNTASARTAEVISTMNRMNAMCQGAPGQIANGFYRIVEMLSILASVIAPEISSRVSAVIADMERMNRMAQSAPQQGACGSCAIANIAHAFAMHFDTEHKYAGEAQSTLTLMSRNNSMCQGADQQSANYLYRAFDFGTILAKILIDKAALRITQYWEEHTEEHQQLLEEKAQLNKQIEEIVAEANAVVPDSQKCSEIRAQIREQETARDAIGAGVIGEHERRIAALRGEKAALGFFAFGAKKRKQQEIDEAVQQKTLTASQIEADRKPYSKRIEELLAQLKSVENLAKVEKERILAKRTPLLTRIAAIDNELTRPR